MSSRRPNPVFSKEYGALLDAVVEARRAAGLSQRQLAARLGKAQSHICMIERRQRRIDALELYYMATAFQLTPEELFGRAARRIEAVRAADGAEAASG
jgi:transcriptional regulator with XRE-family HTH domain